MNQLGSIARPPIRDIPVPYKPDLRRLHATALGMVRFRLQLAAPLTTHQMVTAAMLSERYNVEQIAAVLGCRPRTVRFHIKRAAIKIPSDLPPIVRIITWYRGADIGVLTGDHVHSPLLTDTDGARSGQAVSSAPTADSLASLPARS